MNMVVDGMDIFFFVIFISFLLSLDERMGSSFLLLPTNHRRETPPPLVE